MIQEFRAEEQQINQKIEQSRKRIAELENDLLRADVALEELAEDRQKYSLVSEIADRLDQLKKIGGLKFFWGENTSEQQAVEHYNRVLNAVVNFDSKIKELQQQREDIKGNIQSVLARINILQEEIEILHEREEERENEFVIEREMTHPGYHPMAMPWSMQAEDERRFRKIVLITLLLTFLLGILVPMWDLPVKERDEVIEIPERLAKLIVEKQAPPPPPPPVEKKLEELKEEKKPSKEEKKPQPEEAKLARKKAEKSGLLAFSKDFAELMDTSDVDKLGAQARITNKGQTATKVQRSLVTAEVAGSSGGINTAALSRDVGGAGKGLAGVEFSRVESSIGGDFFGEERPLSDGIGPSRTDEEIQIVFDRYKSALYRIYNRKLRENPTLQGKVVLRITIEPDGSVSMCKLDSSDMKAPDLEADIVERVTKFNFGAKEGVPTITILYPIDFLPTS